MSLEAKVTPSYNWPNLSTVSLARLRLTARPTVEIIGQAGNAQIGANAISWQNFDTALQGRFISAKDPPFGAVGDGVVNDTPAIMKAIDVLRNAGGGKLRLPKGIYRLDKTVDGVAIGQFEASQNYALRIDFSNIIIEGDGMGLTILRQATTTTSLLYVTGGIRNVGVSGVTFEGLEATADWAGCAKTLSIKGQDPALATSKIDQGWTLCTLVSFIGLNTDYMTNVFMSDCEIKNAQRYGVALGWLNCARFVGMNIRYYDGFSPPEHQQPQLGGRVGIVSGAEKVNDVVVSASNFNGNVFGNPPGQFTGPTGTLYYTYYAADGFTWFGKGGNYTVTGCTIRNYALEATNFAGGPGVCTNNGFYTTVGTPSAVAMFAAPDSPRSVDIDNSSYSFCNNIVVGGAGAAWIGKGIFYDISLPTPRSRTVLNNNIIDGVTSPFSGIGADTLECSGNVVTGCAIFFTANFSPLDVNFPSLDFRNKFCAFCGNTIKGCTDVCFALQNPCKPEGAVLIENSVLSRGNYHALFGNPFPITLITAGGTGYTSATVAVTGGGFVTVPTATVTVVAGAVTGIVWHSGGAGGNGSIPTLTISGDGTGASATVTGFETYNVVMSDNVYIDYLGIEAPPLLYTPISPSVKLQRIFGRTYQTSTAPRTPSPRMRLGDTLRNDARSKGAVLFWEAISEGSADATFEPVFSASRGVCGSGSINAASAATPVELLPRLEGQSLRIFWVSVINAKACTWSGAGTPQLRIRTKPASGSPVTICSVLISKLIAATTMVAPADIVWVQPSSGVGGAGGSHVVGAGLEVIGWDGGGGNQAENMSTDVGGDGPVIVAVWGIYEFATSV